MLLLPKKQKYRRTFKGRMRGKDYRGNHISFGEFALKSTSTSYLTSRQIEAARKAIVHHLKRSGKLWIRVFPDKPITRKPNEIRMGSGKGPVDHYVAVVKPGRVIFELSGVDEELAKRALQLASHKLPLKTKYISVKDNG